MSASAKFNNLLLIGFFNQSICFDDYNCDLEKHALMLHRTFAAFCFLLCFIGIVINPIIIPAYNLLNNRSGFTFYLTIISILDLFYLLFVMITFVVRYIPTDYKEQMVIYSTFTAHIIPFAIPLISFCEILVVWLILALLVDRLLFLRLGFQSKTMQTRSVSVKVTLILTICAFLFMIPKCFEFKTDTFTNIGLSRVVYKEIGKNYYFRNLFNQWLKVPMEMFFPYLGIAVFVSMIISRMLIEKARYRKLWILSNVSICCPWIFNSFSNDSKKPATHDNEDVPQVENSAHEREKLMDDDDEIACTRCNSHIESDKISDSVSLDNISLKNRPSCQHTIAFDEMLTAHNLNREKTNVLIGVSLGLLLLCLKLPKFFLHVFESENYEVYDSASFKATNYLLDVIYAMAKPFVCFALGGHFRWAIVGACCKSSRTYVYDSEEHIKNLYLISEK